MAEFEALPPAEMAKKAEDIGEKKANSSFSKTALLAMLAGAFIAMGSLFSTIVQVGGETAPYGIVKMLAGAVFSVGLALVVIGGAELFTGNTLLSMAFLSKRISLGKLLRNWTIVYFGNFLGAVIIAALIFGSGQFTQNHGQVGAMALKIANSKCSLDFFQAILLGIMCNVFVCLAVWLTYACKSVADKVVVIILPIAAFVAAGFEHSVANMYFLPLGYMIKVGASAQFWTDIGKTAADFGAINWSNILVGNLVPVTIGNIIGGGIFIGVTYWVIYRKLAR
ncbi:MAG: formate transporter FocA [Caldisericia bacterium]|nr:formate transporter FocA [Caldisericia bacterium]